MQTSGIVFDIKGFAIHDGPGIRTTVFFKGCPLRCDWCHNPESQSAEPVLAQFPHNCIGCGKCLLRCPQQGLTCGDTQIIIDRDKCLACGTCAETCYAEALVVRGRRMTVEAVMAEVLKDRPFYENSGGGMTLSGGEPLFQPEFAIALLRAAKAEGLHTCLDTSGYVSWAVLEEAMQYTDLVLYDLKTVSPQVHRAWTGRSNQRILENLRALTSDGADVQLRMPLVPGFNDQAEDMAAAARFIMGLPHPPPLEILPYHKLGEGKYEALGVTGGFHAEPPEREAVEALAEIAREQGVECEVGG
ncbi:MAG: glycyl-radical enzyme activating protein [Armatimonadetes bacterium]|nr:glycyl-radical enzyme activating protein [Armatimonadota bacterium]